MTKAVAFGFVESCRVVKSDAVLVFGIIQKGFNPFGLARKSRYESFSQSRDLQKKRRKKGVLFI